jgi:hypothetical protein
MSLFRRSATFRDMHCALVLRRDTEVTEAIVGGGAPINGYPTRSPKRNSVGGLSHAERWTRDWRVRGRGG